VTGQNPYLSSTRHVFSIGYHTQKIAFVIMQRSNDNRERLQAMQLFKDTHLVKLELLSNDTTIDSALNYIIRNKQQHMQYKKLAYELAYYDNDKDDQPSHKHTVF
jgi:hypothetical protein